MKKYFVIITATFCSLFFAPTFANAATPADCETPEMTTKALVMTALRSGTVVSLELNESYTTDELQVGNTLDFFVRSNVTVNGRVVISTGSIAEGRVKKVTTGCNGKCASITIIVDNVQAVDGQRIFLRSRPHQLKAKCCNNCDNPENSATLQIGTSISSHTLNNVDIDA